MNEITHKLDSQNHSKHIFTIRGLCGYYEVYDLEVHKQYDTPFIEEDYNCEECLREEGLALLERL